MMEAPSNPLDKAGRPYWDALWRDAAPPAPIEPRAPGLNNVVNRRFHETFAEAFAGRLGPGAALIEVGCARSAWLPYFAREFGFRVTGLDYSEVGCRQAEDVLRRSDVAGRIVCADLFAPPADLVGAFDAAVTFGVVEHFADTSAAMAAIGKLLKPGGLALTVVPNLHGLTGALTRLLDRAVYDVHVPLDPAALAAAHEKAGLEVLSCRHVLAINLGVVSAASPSPLVARLTSWTSKAVWLAESAGLRIPPNGWTSPYVFCLARRRE